MLANRRTRLALSCLAFAAFIVASFTFLADQALAQRSCGGAPPKAKPHRRKGGESFAPLPLPVTPLRRTEKKRPPSPPALVGKIQYGKIVWATDERGQRYSYYDWTTDPSDIANLLKWTNKQLGIRYRPQRVKLQQFSYDPAEIPILYLTGHEAFSFSDDYRKKLRWFLQDGGYLIGDACCGQKPFSEAFIKEVRQIFPDRPLEPLDSDHPLYNCFYHIKNVTYCEGTTPKDTKSPYILGITLGCRSAVLAAPYDLSCGWDGHDHDTGPRIKLADAKQLGANMITYCLANYQLGRALSTEKVYFQKDEKTRDELVFGQVMHDGDWDPDPSAVMNLLKYVGKNSTMEVQFKRANVDLRKVDAFQYPFLYMTGHKDFHFTNEEINALRSYLRNGGLLLVDSCCGRAAFDRAFRREMKRALPTKDLQRLPTSHPVYRSRHVISSAKYTDMVRQSQPDMTAPSLEGISLGGVLCVVYSPYDMGCGWEEMVHPYSKGYHAPDALKLGLNVLTYSMTH